MCCCKEPNRNGEPGYSWDGKHVGVRPVDPPTLKDGDTLIFDEPGRCKPKVHETTSAIDFHCHHFRLVVAKHTVRSYVLLVKHGGGEERIELAGSYKRIEELLRLHDSDGRYLLLHTLYDVHKEARRAGERAASHLYVVAFIEGRLRKRRQRGAAEGSLSQTKVWIESRPTQASV